MSKNYLLKLIKQLKDLSIKTHYYCEDSWYSCPKHPEGSSDNEQPDKCSCGADNHNKKVNTLYNIIMEII